MRDGFGNGAGAGWAGNLGRRHGCIFHRAPAQPPAVVVAATDEAQLKERVLARWKALIQRDFEAAYPFETPAYRAIYTPRQFLAQQGGQVDWRMANVKDIRLCMIRMSQGLSWRSLIGTPSRGQRVRL